MSDVTIVLNKSAIDALFPEGSVARIDLAEAAIKRMVDAHIKPQHISAHIMSIVEEQSRKAEESVMQKLGITSAWHKYELGSKFKQSLVDEVNEAIRVAVKEAVAPAVETASKEVAKRVAAEMNLRVHQEVNKLVAEALRTAVNSALNLQPKA